MSAEEVVFSNRSLKLAGTLYLPEGQGPHPALVVAHAASGGMRSFPFYQHLTERLPASGIAALIYDRRGSGLSGGDFSTASFADLAEDACAALAYLHRRAEIDAARSGLYGISQGGWIAPMAAARTPGTAFMVIVSGCGVSPSEQMDYAARYTLQAAGFSEGVIAQALALRHQVNEYYRGNLPRQLLVQEIARVQDEPWFSEAFIDRSEDLPQDVTRDKWYYELDYDPLPAWRQVQQPALFLFAEEDRWVPVEESISQFRSVVGHLLDVTLARIEGTDHMMSALDRQGNLAVSESYIAALLAWLEEKVKAK
jgi:hypothetical protein